MQPFINCPKRGEEVKLLLNNLATFKAELILESIACLNIEDKTKDEVLEKVLKILNDKSDNDII